MSAVDISGRIGPNAIIRMGEALAELESKAVGAKIFQMAGLAELLEQTPQGMVEEAQVTALARAVHDTLGADRSTTVGWVAGQRTADYLLAHRIPGPAQSLLKALPPAMSSRLLAGAIAQHTWTFAGSGRVRFHWGNPTEIVIANSPLCRGITSSKPACAYYAGTFERLFRELVSADARCVETACAAAGAEACAFAVGWPGWLGLSRSPLARGQRLSPRAPLSLASTGVSGPRT